jgi:hypothetical protein
VTVNLALSDGTLSFDTGLVTLSNISTLVLATGLFYQGLPVSGSYSLVTGGQTYTGSFSYTINWISDDAANTYYNLSLTGYPSSIQLSGLGNGGFSGCYFLSPGTVAEVTATNGFQLDLVPGSEYIEFFEDRFSIVEAFEWGSPPTTATNVGGTAASITVTAQPQSVFVNAGDTASFSVTASGILPLSYQWSLNGTNIAGGTSSNFYSTLTITNVAQTNLGAYSVTVSDAYGSTTSSNAILSMYPFIANPFTGAVTYWGQSSTLSVGAWGTGPLSYQWFDNGNAVDGATNSALTLSTIQAANAGLYSVVVTSALGSATNPPAQVVVEPAGVSVALYPGVTINGVVGYNYIIQRKASLSDTNPWMTLTNLTLTQSNQIWFDSNTDASVPPNSYRFYQVLPGQ